MPSRVYNLGLRLSEAHVVIEGCQADPEIAKIAAEYGFTSERLQKLEALI